jgi:putative DNA primase/helicase
MTYKQAQSVGAQVRRTEQGTRIQYWKIADQVPVKDANAKAIFDGSLVISVVYNLLIRS